MRCDRKSIPGWFAMLFVLLVVFGCDGSSDDGPPADGDAETENESDAKGDMDAEADADNDAEADPDGDMDADADESPLTRSFYFSAAPMQYDVTDSYVASVFDTTGFEGRIDIISLHMDFFGLPWDEFGEGASPPAFWVERMTEIRAAVEELGVGVFLSLTPLNGTRNGLMEVPLLENGSLQTRPGSITGCFDFESAAEKDKIRAAYKAYVRWMTDFFDPVFLANVIELNMYGRNCPDEYESLLPLLNEVYETEKALDPERVVFPTFVMDMMWGYEDGGACEIGSRTCLVENLGKIDTLKRDRFGVSHYPFGMKDDWARIPEDYYRAVAEITGDRIVFGEIGYPDRSLVFPYPELTDDCVTALTSSEDEQKAFLLYLFEEANRLGSDLVCWWSLRDYLPESLLTQCPCDAPGLWCLLYEGIFDLGLLPAWLQWGSMGLVDHELQPKSALDVWREWQARPIETQTGVSRAAEGKRR